MKKSALLTILTWTVGIVPAYATTVYYQPTPYPTNVTNGVHVWDGWLGNVYSTTFTRDDKLQVGGWGDTYRTYTKFDVRGLPSNVSQVNLWLMPYQLGGAGGTNVNFYLPTSSWNTNMTWSTQPPATSLGQRTAPIVNQWWGTTITSWYTSWVNNSNANFGLRLDPASNNNNFDYFRSSRYASDGYRPILQLDFTPPVTVPSFLMPLPGSIAWAVTTEIGGWDCFSNNYDAAHDNLNYFSIDFSWRNLRNGAQVYGDPNANPNINIPIIAAGSGKVAVVGTDPNAPNGYYVVIDHDGDGNVTTGFTTRYLHLKSSPAVSLGQVVAQGDTLGYMGKTPIAGGYPVHLHFGTRYADSGTAETMAQYATNNGWILKSFQTECIGGGANRYYLSSNRVYQ